MGLCCIVNYVYVFLTVIVLVTLIKLFTRRKRQLYGKHVMITGGSSGIGLSVAHDVARRGASVTLVARNVSRLEKAQREVELTMSKLSMDGKVQFFSSDISGSVKNISEMVKNAEASLGPVYMLINCAGFARAQKFEDLSPDIMKQMLDINFTGPMVLTQEVVRGMKVQQEGGVVVFVSSQAGLLGLYGFSAYSASKAAIVRAAEALHMELKPHNISVTVCYPPDTDTPGFVEENQTKPIETKLISEAAGLFKPEEVAKKLVDDSLCGAWSSTVGLEGFMLTTLCAGMGPITDAASFMAQVFLSGLFRSVSAFYLWSFTRIVEREHKKRLENKKSE